MDDPYKKPLYTPDALFQIPWIKKSTYRELRLPKLGLVIRVYKEHDAFFVRVRWHKERPWMLAKCHSFAEAKYRAFYFLVEFRIWTNEQFVRLEKLGSMFEFYSRHLYHLYPKELIDGLHIEKYHNRPDKDVQRRGGLHFGVADKDQPKHTGGGEKIFSPSPRKSKTRPRNSHKRQ